MARKRIGTRIRESFADFVRYHSVEMSGVVPAYRWDEKRQMFFINSPAGLIRFKPKSTLTMHLFRSRWLNQFDELIVEWKNGKAQKKDFFKFYRQLLKEMNGATYKANIRTRLRLTSGF